MVRLTSPVLMPYRRALFITFLLVLLLLTVTWNSLGGQTAINVGTDQSEIWLTGFNAVEHAPPMGDYRWSSPVSRISQPIHRGPLLTTLVGFIAPDIRQLQLVLNKQDTLYLPGDPTATRPRIYHVFTPAQSRTNELTLDILTPQSEQNWQSDQRQLGMLVKTLSTHTTTQQAWTFLPLSLCVVLGLLTLFTFLLNALIFNPRISACFSVLIVSGLGIGAVIQPLVVARSLAAILIFVMIGVLTVTMHDLIARRMIALEQKMTLILLFCISIVHVYFIWHYRIQNLFDIVRDVSILGVLFFVLWFLPRRPFWWVFGLVFGWLLIWTIVFVFRYDYASDFTAYFRGARGFIRDGKPLYDLEAISANHLGNSYKYPPFFVFLMRPLVYLTYTPAIQLWRAFNVVMLIGAGIVLVKAYQQTIRDWTTWLLISLMIVMQPITDSLRYAQIDLIVLFFLALTIYFERRRQPRWAGLSLVIPIVIKLYPALLVLYFVRQRAWRALGACLAGCVLATGVSVVVFGWDVHWQFLTQVLPRIGGGTVWVENQTFNGWLNRLVTTTIQLKPDSLPFIRWLSYAGLALTVGITYRHSQYLQPSEGFSLWILVMLGMLPATWIHYHVLLLIPAYQIIVRVAHAGALPPRRVMLLYMLGWMVLFAGNQWTFFDKYYYGVWWAQLLSYKWYGLVLWWIALARDPQARAMRKASQQFAAPDVTTVSVVPIA